MKRKIEMGLLTACFMTIGILGFGQSVYAEKISNVNQAEAKALEKVPDGVVTDVDKDHENGTVVYDVEVVKGNKKYDITYRASDAKILEYSWEKISVSASRSRAIIKESKCKSLAQKKVTSATVNSIVRKRDDGIDVYKVKMTDDTKSYTLEYHARTGALIEYEWKVIKGGSSSSSNKDNYIGIEKAEEIALDDVPGADVVKSEFDMDDGVPVYEIELIKGSYEYEYKIHAKTGEILEHEMEFDD